MINFFVHTSEKIVQLDKTFQPYPLDADDACWYWRRTVSVFNDKDNYEIEYNLIKYEEAQSQVMCNLDPQHRESFEFTGKKH